MTRIELSSVVERHPGLISAEMDGEVVMMSIEHSAYFGLNEVATAVWAELEQPSPVSEICDRLLAKFEVERTECEADVLELLNEMQERDMVKLAG